MTSIARLETLRRQAGASGSSSAIATFPVTSSFATEPGKESTALSHVDCVEHLQQRVSSLRRLLGTRNALRERPTLAATWDKVREGDRTLPGVEVATGLRLIEKTYPLPDLPAMVALTPLRSTAQRRHAEREAPHGEVSVATTRLLAIDTETTGLAGGTGTRAFMIGVADLDQQRLRVRQLLITTLAGEPGMLRMFCDWLRDDHVLVSYNGRSYDRPLLSTRLRLARFADPLPARVHLDLLHVTRRAYRGIWPNCRLATAERELLGVLRDDDLPGSEAPAAWLTYLRGGSSAALARVVTHNDQDLRSLMGLLAHFTNLGA